ncbi:hypothetical protein ACROYT_G031198 [Oculina patagonica]
MSSTLEGRETGVIVVEATSLILLNVVSLAGNSLICWAVYRNRSLRTTTNLYIIALAVSDLSSAIFVMPFSSGVLITGDWRYGSFYCNIQGFFVVLNIYVSPCLMALTAFNRYVRIVRTNIYHKLFSMRKCKLWIIAVWIVVITYVLTQVLVGNQAIRFVPPYAVCSTTHLKSTQKVVHYSIVIPAFVVAPIVITSVCYYKIFRAIKFHNKNVLPSLQSRNSTSTVSISSREIRTSISLFVVVIVFACCWIPLWVLALLFRFQLVESLPRNVTLLISFLVFFSSTINPFIYAGMNRSFRNEIRRICLPETKQETNSLHIRQGRRTEDEEPRFTSLNHVELQD